MRALVVSILLLTAAIPAAAETINFLNWEDYIDRSILKEWTARTGVSVNEIYIDTGDERDAVLSDPANDIDVAVVNEATIGLFGRRGVLEPMDPKRVAVMAEYKQNRLQRCAGHGLPYLWGTMGILYRTDRIDPAPTSWRDLMVPARKLYGHIAMFNDTRMTFVAPLMLLGRSINATDDAVLKEAYAALKTQAPAVLTYEYVLTSAQDPRIGNDIWMALGYSGDQYALNARPGSLGTWAYVVPVEGSLQWQDCLSVSATSKKKDLAFDLLNEIAGKRGALRNAMTLKMPPTNAKAMEEMPATLRDDPSTYPSPEVLARSQPVEEMPADAVQRRRRIINALVNFRDTQ